MRFGLDEQDAASQRTPAESAVRLLRASPESSAALTEAMRRWLRDGEPRAALAAALTHRVARTQTPAETMEPLLRTVAAADPSLASLALLTLARHQVRWSRLVSAQLTLAELADRDIDAESRVHVALLRARTCLRQGSPQAATFALQEAGIAIDSDARLGLMLGEVQVWSGQLTQGRRTLTALALPETGMLTGRRDASMALSYVLEQDGDEALRWVARARTAYRSDLPPMLAALEIIAWIITEDLDCAWASTTTLERQPTASAFGRGLRDSLKSFVLWRRGDLSESVRVGESALQLLDGEVDRLVGPLLANALARAHLGLGHLQRAEALLRASAGSTAASGLKSLGAACAVTRLLWAAAHGNRAEAREQAYVAAGLCPGSPLVGVERQWADGDLSAPSVCASAAAGLASLRAAELAVHEGRWADGAVAAETAVGWYDRIGAQYDLATALLLRAEAELQLGLLSQSRRTLATCATLADSRGYRIISTGALLLQILCNEREGNLADAIGELRRLPQVAGPDLFCHDLQEVSLQFGLSPPLPPRLEHGPLRSLVQRLRLTRPRHAIVGLRDRIWLVGDEDELATSDLLVRVDRGEAQCGDTRTAASPQAIGILTQLSEGPGKTVEELYLTVWGGESYHPLRHRNAIYTAIKRLRKMLQTLCGRDLLVRRSDGRYALLADVRVAVRCTLDDATGCWPAARWRRALQAAPPRDVR